jgi:hypothetical protein
MQRWVSTLVGAAVVVLALWVTMRGYHASKSVGLDPGRAGDAGAGTDAGWHPEPRPLLTADGLQHLDDLADPSVGALRGDSGVGVTLPDGTPVPPLPMSAPRQLRFGVVLVSYAGAQPAANGGRPATRSHSDAKVLAENLAATAARDFHAAVQQGDPGSADDVGRVRLGVLEPAPEYVLFSLPVDGIGGPVDTPRGYWVVKRLE